MDNNKRAITVPTHNRRDGAIRMLFISIRAITYKTVL